MTRTVQGTLTLAPVDVGSLPAAVDHYAVVAVEAAGTTVNASAAVDATSVSFDLTAGSWVVTVSAVDAAGNALTQPVTASPNPLVVTDQVVTVNVPIGLALSVV